MIPTKTEYVGRRVFYRPYEECDLSDYEYGEITSMNDKYIFVRFDGDVNAKACMPESLYLDEL